ncbi:hypothetical protein Pan161_19800 [Gimesia algae]|uniref:Uncharacterized protein n=1 Tax=Gimesia algae TaxID=2527971 RepID=A0A517VBE7_9PLAN|nr:hypothetical protein Pan161_19800 [Gimesia algae]
MTHRDHEELFNQNPALDISNIRQNFMKSLDAFITGYMIINQIVI